MFSSGHKNHVHVPNSILYHTFNNFSNCTVLYCTIFVRYSYCTCTCTYTCTVQCSTCTLQNSTIQIPYRKPEKGLDFNGYMYGVIYSVHVHVYMFYRPFTKKCSRVAGVTIIFTVRRKFRAIRYTYTCTVPVYTCTVHVHVFMYMYTVYISVFDTINIHVMYC